MQHRGYFAFYGFCMGRCSSTKDTRAMFHEAQHHQCSDTNKIHTTPETDRVMWIIWSHTSEWTSSKACSQSQQGSCHPDPHLSDRSLRQNKMKHWSWVGLWLFEMQHIHLDGMLIRASVSTLILSFFWRLSGSWGWSFSQLNFFASVTWTALFNQQALHQEQITVYSPKQL